MEQNQSPKNDNFSKATEVASSHLAKAFEDFASKNYLAAIDHLLKMTVDGYTALSENSHKVLGAEEINAVIAEAITLYLKTIPSDKHMEKLEQLLQLKAVAEKVFASYGRIEMAFNLLDGTFPVNIAELSCPTGTANDQIQKLAESIKNKAEESNKLKVGEVDTILKILKMQLIGKNFLDLFINNLINYFIPRVNEEFTFAKLKLAFSTNKVPDEIFPTQLLEYLTDFNRKVIIESGRGYLDITYKDNPHKSKVIELLISLSIPFFSDVFERLTGKQEPSLPKKLSEYTSRRNIGKKYRKHSYHFIVEQVIPFYLQQYTSNAISLTEAIHGLASILKAYLAGYMKAKETEESRTITKNKGKGNKFIRLLQTGISLALDLEQTSLDEEASIKLLLSNLSQIINFINPNSRLVALSPLLEDFIELPILKEHTLYSHEEKIEIEFLFTQNLIKVKSAVDCVQFFKSFSPMIEESRKKGKMLDSMDLENHLRELCDKLIALLVLGPEPHKFNFEPKQLVEIFDAVCNEQIISKSCVSLIKEISKHQPELKMELEQKLLTSLFIFPKKINKQSIDIDLLFYERAKAIGKEFIIDCYEQAKKSKAIPDKNLHGYAFAFNVKMLSNLMNNPKCIKVSLIPLEYIAIDQISEQDLIELQIDLKLLISSYKDYTKDFLQQNPVMIATELMKKINSNQGSLPESKQKQKTSLLSLIARSKTTKEEHSVDQRRNTIASPPMERKSKDSGADENTKPRHSRRNSISSPILSQKNSDTKQTEVSSVKEEKQEKTEKDPIDTSRIQYN